MRKSTFYHRSASLICNNTTCTNYAIKLSSDCMLTYAGYIEQPYISNNVIKYCKTFCTYTNMHRQMAKHYCNCSQMLLKMDISVKTKISKFFIPFHKLMFEYT